MTDEIVYVKQKILDGWDCLCKEKDTWRMRFFYVKRKILGGWDCLRKEKDTWRMRLFMYRKRYLTDEIVYAKRKILDGWDCLRKEKDTWLDLSMFRLNLFAANQSRLFIVQYLKRLASCSYWSRRCKSIVCKKVKF